MDEDMIAYKKGITAYVDKFDKLEKKIYYIRQEISSMYRIDTTKEGIKDVRYLVFDHMFASIKHSRLLLKFTDYDCMLRECDSIPNMGEIIVKRLIYYPIPCFYHAIENCFFKLLKALDKEYANDKYYQLVENIFTKLSMPKDGDAYKSYEVLGCLRNSMHNNWVHEKQNKGHTIKNVEFPFSKGGHIAFKSEDHIFILMDTIIESLLTIMRHSEIQKLKSEDCHERFAQSLDQK